MADNLKAAAAAAGLTPAEQKAMAALSKTLSVHRELSNLPQATANRAYNSKTPQQQAELVKVAGQQDPASNPGRGWLQSAWHYLSMPVVEPIKLAFKGAQEASDLTTRLFRTAAIAIDQGKPLYGKGNAWDIANDKGDKVFNPGTIDTARKQYGDARIAVAMRVAAGEKLSAIAATGTPEEKQIAALASQNKDDLFQDALNKVNSAKYSPGRFAASVVDKLTPGDLVKNGFAYKAISGFYDASWRIFADPTLVIGKIRKAHLVANYALDVVVGGNKVGEVFAKPAVVNFWNSYGADLANYKKAVGSGDTIAAAAAKRKLEITAPEFGPAVIKSFLNEADGAVPITNAETAKAFFLNADQTAEMMKGQIGRKRVMIPRLDPLRKARVTTVTTANKLFNIDRIGPKFVDDLYFGGAATDDGIAEAIIDGQKTIITNIKGLKNAKGTARFSMEQIQYRIDRFKSKFEQVPIFDNNSLDVTDANAARKVYLYARMVLPKTESKLIAQVFDEASLGRKKEIFYGLQGTIADIRGLNVTKEGLPIFDTLTGKVKQMYAMTDETGYNPAMVGEDPMGLILSDMSDFVTTLSIKDIDRASARSGLIQRMLGVAHSGWVDKMTSAWSFATLAGPRYAIRNATEDLMVHLAIGESPWGLVKGRMLSTRLRTARGMEAGLTKAEKMSNNPLGGVMRFINRKEAKSYGAAIQAADGDIKKIREIMATALNEGKIARFNERTGLGKFTKEDRAILAEQIQYGDLDNALADVIEGGKNSFTGVDSYTRTLNYARKSKVRTAELGLNLPKNISRAKGARAMGPIDPSIDEASLVAYAMRIGYYSNDKLGGIAVANLVNAAKGSAEEKAAVGKVLEWFNDPKNAKLVAGFRMEERGITNAEHAQRIYDAAKQLFVKNDGSLNTVLLDKVRKYDDATGQMVIYGKIGLDDLPTGTDLPRQIVGPQLVAVTDTGNYTTSIMEWGWDWLGEANARFSREPMVLAEMIKIRKQMKKTGFEDAFIKAHTKGITGEVSLARAEKNARYKLAQITEERAAAQTLAYVDNPLIQSQLAFSGRNFARFYRATEDFYRRVYRVLRYNPESIARASLTYEGVTHSGWVQHDDQGEPYFIYPGTQYVYKAVQGAMQALGVPAEFKVPMPVQFGANLKMITPSLNPDSAIPTLAGPLSGVSVKVFSNIVGIFDKGAADTITGAVLGKYAVGQSMVSAFLPAHVNRIYQAMNQDERDGQYASAARKAITYLEASGHGLKQKFNADDTPIPFTAKELEEYRLKIKNTTLGILGMRVIYGFVAPASPSVQLKSDMADWVRGNGEANFKQAWYGLLDKTGNYDKAMAEWVKSYPDQIPFTISESDRSTVAYFRYANESGEFVDKNQQLFKDYKQGATFLIPNKAGYSWDAYKTMTDMGLRKNKTVSDFLREVQSASDMQAYYDKKNQYELNLESAGTDFERSQLRKEFTDWATVFKSGRPLVQEELSQGSQKAIERINALNDLTAMLKDKAAFSAAPSTANALKKMVDLYESYKNTKDELDNFGRSQFLSQMNKDETILKMRELAKHNENTMSAYNVLFGRLLGD
jgi:hypothetical protein